MTDEKKPPTTTELVALFESLIDERMAYWRAMTLKLLERVRGLEAKMQPSAIRCPSWKGNHPCELEINHPGNHRGVNDKEEWYAWARR